MGDWRDFEEGRRGISLAQLPDGATASVFVDDQPFLNEEEIDQPDGSTETSESLRVPVIPETVPDGFEDMSGDAVETVEDPYDAGEDAPRYYIINSSTAFKSAMRDAFPDGVSPVEAIVDVTAHVPEDGDQYSRTYTVEPQ